MEGLSSVSNAEMLRGVIAEKLTTAAQEILAVVERTIAGYEQDAAGLRQEIDRQGRQLELLLRPEIKLETTDDQFPVCEPAAGGGGDEDEEQHKHESSVEGSWGLGLICYNQFQMEDDEEHQEPLTEADDEAASRFLTPTVQSDWRSVSRGRVRKLQTHIDLKFRILEDSGIDVVSAYLFKKHPLQELRCPLGLTEDDFLDLLSSTFPQLAAREPFDIFTTRKNKRLYPLRLETLTPEELHRTTGHSVLYLRLKAEEEEEEHQEPLTEADDEAASRFLTPTVQSDRRIVGRGRIREPEPLTHVDLKFRILEDSGTKVLSAILLKKHPLQELRCPRGLTEDDFLDLLSSTFPQLAARESFDVFTTKKNKKLRPLRLETLTPEELHRTRGHSVLYLRLKKQEEELQESSSTSGGTRLKTSPVLPSQSGNTIADEAEGERSAPEGPRAPLVLSESDGNGDGDGDDARDDDWKPVRHEKHLREDRPEKKSKRRVEPPDLRTRNIVARLSCQVCLVLRRSPNMLLKHAWKHVDDPERRCGVCGDAAESADDLRRHLHGHQKTHVCHVCGKSFLTRAGLQGHVARHDRNKPHTCAMCSEAFAGKSQLTSHTCVHAPAELHTCDACQQSCVSEFELERHRQTCGQTFSSVHDSPRHTASVAGRTLACEICSKEFYTKQKLQTHMRLHSDKRSHVCSRCSKRYLQRSHLEAHMRSHTGEKPYSCCVCNLAFSLSHCLKRHMKTHRGAAAADRTHAPGHALHKQSTEAVNGAKRRESFKTNV